jgi:dolichyl-phosphate-mannose--protein O-mannosyl transferase
MVSVSTMLLTFVLLNVLMVWNYEEKEIAVDSLEDFFLSYTSIIFMGWFNNTLPSYIMPFV